MGCDFCVFISTNGIAKQSFYRGEDSIEKLLDTLSDWLFWCYNGKQLFRRLRISTQQREQLLNMTNVLCCICGKGVETPARVIHHCHLSGTIFGVAHSHCNLRARSRNFLPVFFHNLSRYDAHHILKQLKLKAHEELSPIAKTDDFYFFQHQNSCGLLQKAKRATREIAWIPSVPGQLSICLAKPGKSCEDTQGKWFFNTSSFFPTFLIICLSNSHRKVSFPTAISTVPKNSKNRFLLIVTLGKRVSLAQMTLLHLTINMHWIFTKSFGCRNLGDYHDIYLKTDVLLLADIFEKLRNVCLKVYTLDPSHFYSAPNLTWESILISTNVKLGLLQDVDMLLFLERGIRGGINGLGELRHFTANNSHLNSFDPNEKTTFGTFFDVTSLYAGTMQKMMPLGNYKWNSVISFDPILGTPEDSNLGYFVEVDLKYHQHLHHSHNGLPLAPEKLCIRSSWLSPFAKTFGLKSNKTPKLVETLFDKKNYVCSYEKLKFHLNRGLVVDKLHRVCEFEQSKWLGVYTEKNTVMRKQAVNDFEKN